jgi:hypothetical protein
MAAEAVVQGYYNRCRPVSVQDPPTLCVRGMGVGTLTNCMDSILWSLPGIEVLPAFLRSILSIYYKKSVCSFEDNGQIRYVINRLIQSRSENIHRIYNGTTARKRM